MTTADPQHARPGGFSQARGRFRRWRRIRPFWGGLLTALAGVQIFGTTQMSLGGLSFQMGPTGFLSWLIPTILVACGMFMWFTPQHRMFYAVIAAVTALFSLIGVNLGGFFIGLLLGMVGSALGFAWTPAPRAAATVSAPDPGSSDDGPVPPDVDPEPMPELADRERILADERTLTDEIMPVAREDRASPADPRFLAVMVALLSLAAIGLTALDGPTPVRAAAPAADCPTRTASPPPPPATGTPAPDPTASSAGTPTGKPGPGTPTEELEPVISTGRADGNLLTDLVDGLGDLLTGGDDESRAEPTRTPTATPSTPSAPTPSAPTPSTAPSGTPSGQPTVTPAPTATTGPGCPTPTPQPGRPLPRAAADPGQPLVGGPSKLTGSRVVMNGFRFDGIVDLRTVDGTLRAMKFSMTRAVTDDFVLQAPGPAGRTLRYVTDQLTVQGDVAFYATRFTGRLSLLGGPGLIPITLTPDLPLPDGLPITAPQLAFGDPVIDLAFVDCDVLTTGDELLRLTLD